MYTFSFIAKTVCIRTEIIMSIDEEKNNGLLTSLTPIVVIVIVALMIVSTSITWIASLLEIDEVPIVVGYFVILIIILLFYH